jgi:hypothetical protein
MQDDYYQPKKSWWDRNWKWFVPTGCLSIIIIFVAFIGALFLGIGSLMTNSDAYKESMAAAERNKTVIENLGTPLENDGMVSGSINSSNNTGNCDLEIPIKGPKGKGILFVVATKNVKWKYTQMSVYIEKTDEEINLLKQ